MKSEELMDREARAGHVLAAYRERRRRRRAEDTWFGSATCTLEHAEANLAADAVVTRRQELLEDAASEGMPIVLAEQLYDVAREEGLDPALAYEVVRSGLGICPPAEGVSNAPEQPSSDKYAPAWVLQPSANPDDVLRERMLRLSFRRLRGLLEQHPEPAEALRHFALEPDVGVFGY